MAKKPKEKPALLPPAKPPDSFTRSALLKAIKKIVATRRQGQSSVSDEAK